MQPVVTSRLVWQARSEQWNKADFDGYLQSQPPRTCTHKHLNQLGAQLCYDVVKTTVKTHTECTPNNDIHRCFGVL